MLLRKLRISKGRLNPESPSAHYSIQRHLAAYEFAKRFVKGRRVLDAGCGAGYGSHHLSLEASSIFGADFAFEAVVFAKETFRRPSLYFICSDLLMPPFLSEQFNVVVSFQLIEHLKDPLAYFRQIDTLLTPKGIFIVSTLNRERTSAGLNPYHVKEYSLDEFKQLCLSYFKSVTFYGVFGSERYAEIREEEIRFGRLFLKLDPWGLRHRLSKGLWERLYTLSTAFVQSFVSCQKPGAKTLTVNDFYITDQDIKNALDFIAVCEKRSQ